MGFAKYINLLISQTIPKNCIRFQSYCWFFKVDLFKNSKKFRLEKVSKQSTLGMIFEEMELNKEIPRKDFVDNSEN